MTPLFQAVAEASEESVYNALFAAHDVKGHRGEIKALPAEAARAIIAGNGLAAR